MTDRECEYSGKECRSICTPDERICDQLSKGLVATIIAELEKAKDKQDPLTKLLTKETWKEKAQRAHESAEKTGKKYAVIFVDLDGFKGINDTHGHQVGDEVLQNTANEIQNILRTNEGDLVGKYPKTEAGRFGGDEFIILVDLTQRSDAPLTEEQRLDAVEERFRAEIHQFFDESGYPIGASIGAALWHFGETLDDVIKVADEQMYIDKGSKGR